MSGCATRTECKLQTFDELSRLSRQIYEGQKVKDAFSGFDSNCLSNYILDSGSLVAREPKEYIIHLSNNKKSGDLLELVIYSQEGDVSNLAIIFPQLVTGSRNDDLKPFFDFDLLEKHAIIRKINLHKKNK